MIVTVTPNTGLDYILAVPGMPMNRTVRSSYTAWGMGGKATDVSWVLGRLGVTNLALGFSAGWTGQKMDEMLQGVGVEVDFTPCDGETRINIILIQEGGGGHSTFTARTLRVREEHLQEFQAKYEAALERATCLVVGGSLPEGLPETFYRDLIRQARARGVPVVFDSSGPSLLEGVAAGPTVIKPNEAEIVDLLGELPRGLAAVREAARQVQAQYGTAVVATLGAEGALAVWGERCWQIPPLQVDVVSAAGAGDGVLAGLALGLAEGQPVEWGLRRGFALAGAILMTPVTADFRMADYARLLAEVVVRACE